MSTRVTFLIKFLFLVSLLNPSYSFGLRNFSALKAHKKSFTQPHFHLHFLLFDFPFLAFYLALRKHFMSTPPLFAIFLLIFFPHFTYSLFLSLSCSKHYVADCLTHFHFPALPLQLFLLLLRRL
jgi:hypothetical protein